MPLSEFYSSYSALSTKEQKLTYPSSRNYYRPFILRTPILAIILAFILVLTGLIEYACRSLPTNDWTPRTHVKRDVAVSESVPRLRRIYYGNTTGSAVEKGSGVSSIESTQLVGDDLTTITSSTFGIVSNQVEFSLNSDPVTLSLATKKVDGSQSGSTWTKTGIGIATADSPLSSSLSVEANTSANKTRASLLASSFGNEGPLATYVSLAVSTSMNWGDGRPETDLSLSVASQSNTDDVSPSTNNSLSRSWRTGNLNSTIPAGSDSSNRNRTSVPLVATSRQRHQGSNATNTDQSYFLLNATSTSRRRFRNFNATNTTLSSHPGFNITDSRIPRACVLKDGLWVTERNRALREDMTHACATITQNFTLRKECCTWSTGSVTTRTRVINGCQDCLQARWANPQSVPSSSQAARSTVISVYNPRIEVCSDEWDKEHSPLAQYIPAKLNCVCQMTIENSIASWFPMCFVAASFDRYLNTEIFTSNVDSATVQRNEPAQTLNPQLATRTAAPLTSTTSRAEETIRVVLVPQTSSDQPEAASPPVPSRPVSIVNRIVTLTLMQTTRLTSEGSDTSLGTAPDPDPNGERIRPPENQRIAPEEQNTENVVQPESEGSRGGNAPVLVNIVNPTSEEQNSETVVQPGSEGARGNAPVLVNIVNPTSREQNTEPVVQLEPEGSRGNVPALVNIVDPTSEEQNAENVVQSDTEGSSVNAPVLVNIVNPTSGNVNTAAGEPLVGEDQPSSANVKAFVQEEANERPNIAANVITIPIRAGEVNNQENQADRSVEDANLASNPEQRPGSNSPMNEGDSQAQVANVAPSVGRNAVIVIREAENGEETQMDRQMNSPESNNAGIEKSYYIYATPAPATVPAKALLPSPTAAGGLGPEARLAAALMSNDDSVPLGLESPEAMVTAFPLVPVILSVSSSLITTALPGALVTSSASGSVITTSLPGSSIIMAIPGFITTISVPESVITTFSDGVSVVKTLPASVITSSVSESLLKSFIPGSVVTRSIPGGLLTSLSLDSKAVSTPAGASIVGIVQGSQVISVSGYLTTKTISDKEIVSFVSGSLMTLPASLLQEIPLSEASIVGSSDGRQVISIPGYLTTITSSGGEVVSSMSGSLMTLPASLLQEAQFSGALIVGSSDGRQVISIPEYLTTITSSGKEVVSSISGSLIILPASAKPTRTMLPTYEALVTGLPGEEVVLSIPGPFSTMSVGGKLITTSLPGYLVTVTLPGSSLASSSAPTPTERPTINNTAVGSGPNRSDRPILVFTWTKYFNGFYLPVLLAIALRALVGMIYAATKMMEPFYCLTQEAGALAKDFLNINYLSTNDSLEPLSAMFQGHWLILLVSILYVTVGLLPSFASELFHFTRFCNSKGECGPEVRVVVTIGRILEGLLAFAAIVLAAFWYVHRKYQSGLWADPSSIATMASLLHNPEVVEDFRHVDPDATKMELQTALADRRYRLIFYRSNDGSDRYGLVRVAGPSEYRPEPARAAYGPLQSSEYGDADPNGNAARRRRLQRTRILRRLMRDIVFVILIVGLIILIIVYYHTGGDTGFERFWNNEGFGPRFVMSFAGMMIHTQWRRIERESSILEPFRELSKGAAPAEKTILANRTIHPITTLAVSLWRRQVFVSLVALAVISSEVLIITLAGIPFNRGQVYIAFLVSLWISVAIMSLMLLLLVALYVRPRGPDLPRTPNTLASIFSYLCASRLLRDFAGLATLDARARRRQLDMLSSVAPRTYVLKKMRTEDQVVRWAVDYDESSIAS